MESGYVVKLRDELYSLKAQPLVQSISNAHLPSVIVACWVLGCIHALDDTLALWLYLHRLWQTPMAVLQTEESVYQPPTSAFRLQTDRSNRASLLTPNAGTNTVQMHRSDAPVLCVATAASWSSSALVPLPECALLACVYRSGTHMATAGADKVVKLWDPTTGANTGSLRVTNLACVAVNLLSQPLHLLPPPIP